jgi:ribosome recycling factor
MNDISSILSITKDEMKKAISHLQHELTKIRAGKASPVMLDGVMVDYYGTPTPIAQVGNITTPDPRTLVVQPWDKSILPTIERAIINANLGFSPGNDGEIIRINVPSPTEERRKELVKQAHKFGEESRIGIRSARHNGLDAVKKLVKDGLSEDEGKRTEAQIESLSKDYNNKIEEILKAKDDEIMTV